MFVVEVKIATRDTNKNQNARIRKMGLDGADGTQDAKEKSEIAKCLSVLGVSEHESYVFTKFAIKVSV